MNNLRDNITPVVGMGATYHCGSDDYPYTVVEVVSKTCIRVTQDRAFYNLSKADYDYVSDLNASVKTLTFRNNGRWVERGNDKGGTHFTLGERRYYMDPHF